MSVCVPISHARSSWNVDRVYNPFQTIVGMDSQEDAALITVSKVMAIIML
jgi:hypothetical protein